MLRLDNPEVWAEIRWAYAEALAEKAGREDGENAGAWYVQDAFGGRVGDATKAKESARLILQGIEDGDPEIMESLPNPPSGEWADDPNLEDYARDWLEDAGIDAVMTDCLVEICDDLVRRYCDAFCEASTDYIENQARQTIDETTDEPHKGHWTLFGQYFCDTCNSPYCENA